MKNTITPSILYLGDFNLEQVENGAMKRTVDEAQTSSGIKYVKTKIVKKGGRELMSVWLVPTYDLTF